MSSCLLILPPPSVADDSVPDYSAAIRQLEKAVRDEMKQWDIPGIAVALVDDQRTVHAAGYGESRRDSIFRCGSISKLFNAMAVMQLVEQGKLNLDAPISSYGGDLLPVNPFNDAPPVTLRELLCHRSGMIREAPVGGYLDDREPTLPQTIASITQTVLVNPPNTKTRYSNVGPSIAGRVVELISSTSYERYQQKHILGPLGMSSSAWLKKDLPRGRLVKSWIRPADGNGGFRRQECPVFDLGTVPAGNLFTTAEDLAKFLSMLAAEGRAANGRILKPETFAQMFTPQLTGLTNGYGIGFGIGEVQGFKVVRHNGAVYGCSSSLAFLPEPKLGVVVLGNSDIVNARITKLANLALTLMLEAKRDVKAPAAPKVISLAGEELQAFAGDYESQSYWASIKITNGKLTAKMSGQPLALRAVAPLRFLADGLMHDAAPLVFERNAAGISAFTLSGQKFERVPDRTPDIPREWRAYLGSYGPKFIPLVISERHGHLYAMTENLADYRLTPLNRQVFAMPPGLYEDEHLIILTDRRGKPHGVNLANMILPRRS